MLVSLLSWSLKNHPISPSCIVHLGLSVHTLHVGSLQYLPSLILYLFLMMSGTPLHHRFRLSYVHDSWSLFICRVILWGLQGDLWSVPSADFIQVHTIPNHTNVKFGESKNDSTAMHASETPGDPEKSALRSPHVPKPLWHFPAFPSLHEF
jgi:hypothetical protein